MAKKKCDSIEEDRMMRLIICKFCHETLEEPIILPCGKAICSKHLLNETNNFKCNLCNNSHDKTVDKFPANEELNELVQICDSYVDLNSIDLGKKYKLAKEKLKDLNELINETELLVKDPEFYIDDYFNKLRNEIDLSKEQLIEDIRDKHEKLIDKIKDIETKCKQNAQNKVSNSKLVEENKESLNEWTQKLRSKLNLDECFEEISSESSQSISVLNYEINQCQLNLLDNKQFKFNLISSKESIFGDFVTKEVETGNLIF